MKLNRQTLIARNIRHYYTNVVADSGFTLLYFSTVKKIALFSDHGCLTCSREAIKKESRYVYYPSYPVLLPY